MYLALAGGVGGAKLADGLARVLAPEELAVVVNTGDDFDHLGLRICPDLDTMMYTLAGVANPETGWGRADETWSFMETLGHLGGETWFRLGDRDLAVHVERTRRLAAGETLTEITASLCRAMGIEHAILPMTDRPVSTIVDTDMGPLPFQEYFVARRCHPAVTGFRFAGAADAAMTPALGSALADGKIDAVVICPSNPFVSIAPILAVPGMRQALERRDFPLVAVSPIVGGAAIKGPAAKMMGELSLPVSAAGVAAWYGDLLDGFLVDTRDAALAAEIQGAALAVRSAQTVMRSDDDRRSLAEDVIGFADSLR